MKEIGKKNRSSVCVYAVDKAYDLKQSIAEKKEQKEIMKKSVKIKAIFFPTRIAYITSRYSTACCAVVSSPMLLIFKINSYEM